MLALYQREGVNPAAGCFPMLLQIPIFFAFYKILFLTIEVRHAPFFGWIQDLSAPDPTSLFNLFGLIPWDPPGFLMIGVWPCLMLTGMMIQRKLNPPPTDPIQRDMALYFPFVMTFIMAKFASGLVIYWTISAYFGIAQQIWIMRKMGVPIHLFGETDDEKAAEVIKKSTEHPEDLGPHYIPTEHDLHLDEVAGEPKEISPPKPKKKKKKK
jgi:YidC/Oxa1 family membrane protein insertase